MALAPDVNGHKHSVTINAHHEPNGLTRGNYSADVKHEYTNTGLDADDVTIREEHFGTKKKMRIAMLG